MTNRKRNTWQRTALLGVIVLGVLILLYAGFQTVSYYYRQSNIQKNVARKAQERLQLKAEQLSLFFLGIKKDITNVANREVITTLLAASSESAEKRRSSIAAVALRNTFSFLAANRDGVYGKLALLSANGTELVVTPVASEYAEAGLSKEMLASIAKSGTTFVSSADNRFAIVHPLLVNNSPSGYLVFWLNPEAPLALLMHSEASTDSSAFALVTDRGHLLYRIKDSKILEMSKMVTNRGGQLTGAPPASVAAETPSLMGTVRVKIEHTPFSAIHVFPSPVQTSPRWLSLTSIIIWGSGLSVIIIFSSIYILMLRSRYTTLKSSFDLLQTEQQYLQKTLEEKEAVLNAIIGELRASLTSLFIIADGARKKMTDIVMPQLNEGTMVIKQAGERVVENAQAILESSRKISSFLGTLASYNDGGASTLDGDIETVDLSEIVNQAKNIVGSDISFSIAGSSISLQTNRALLTLAVENFLIAAAAIKKKGNINISFATAKQEVILEASFVLEPNGWKSISYNDYGGIKSEGGAFVAFVAARKMCTLLGGSMELTEERGFSFITARFPLTTNAE